MARSGEEWGATGAMLVPQGWFWTGYADADGRGRALLNAKGDTLSRVEAHAEKLIREARPSSSSEMLKDHEADYGLPDMCTFGDLTVPERRIAVVARMTSGGGQSLKFFRDLAAAMGYPVEIRRLRPFRCGSHKSRCGRDPLSAEWGSWSTKIKGRRITPFRCGASRCGEPLGVIRRAYDLECELTRRQPGGGVLFVRYED